MEISLSASCNYLCTTADHLLMPLPVPYDSYNFFQQWFPDFMLQMHLHFLAGHERVWPSQQLVAQRFQTLTDMVLLCFRSFSLRKSQPYKPCPPERSNLLITHQRTAWGGKDSVTEARRAGINTTELRGLDFQLQITILLGSGKNTKPHLTIFFICERERIVLSAVQGTGLLLNPLEMFWNTEAWVTLSGNMGLLCCGEWSGNSHHCTERANLSTEFKHTGLLHLCLALTSGSIRNLQF